jgi:DNA-binding CsgD family transcriptional regulator
MTITMLDQRNDARVGLDAETVKSRSSVKSAPGRSAAAPSLSVAASRRDWTPAALRSRDGGSRYSNAWTKHGRHSNPPTTDEDQWMHIVRIVAREIANLYGTTLAPPVAQCATMERPELRSVNLGLTPRQVDVLALMMQGNSNKDICRALDLAQATVKNHVTAILKAFKVTNRTQAVIAVGRLVSYRASGQGAEPYPCRPALLRPEQG